MELEGECRIKSTTLLKLNYAKCIVFGSLLVLSLVGLLLLKYFKKLRALAFYVALRPAEVGEATHIYVKGEAASIQ